MPFCRFLTLLLTAALSLSTYAQQQPASPPSKAQDQAAAQPATKGPGVDAVKVTGTTFESEYFKFTYELPKEWKTLDDTARMNANREAAQPDQPSAPQSRVVTKKTGNKTTKVLRTVHPVTLENYSLMVASSEPVTSISSPILPRINIWANRRVPPFDSPSDHAQFLAGTKRTEVIERPHEVTLDGHSFVRVDVRGPDGVYVSQFVTVMGDYLVGFDFRADSQREMAGIVDTAKTIKFK
jgi:hypothetical protein